ncbi:hypothetical protein PILCRDRAFT_8310 [Piloderma croceum F 1598]|uniref:Uncharacterized protein n=1 Tax=Piloderma croceum (strain F 1598) TaxID=765440 RepID=A0A0C3BXB2_PILCF|nr:hypothetical protein PILCRDRAFT_8310 [Piloderma croceum F 1598]
MHHQHLNLNLGNSGPSSAGPSGLRTPPGTQQQQQQNSGGAPAEQAAPSANTQNPPQAPAPPAVNPVAWEPNNAGPAQPLAPGTPPGAPPLPEAHIIEQQAAELTILRAHLAQQEGKRDKISQPGVPAPAQPVLFADPQVVERAKAAAVAARDGDKKPSLPDIVPGFKANPLDIPCAPKAFISLWSKAPFRL